MAWGKAPDPTAELKEYLKNKKIPGGAWLLCGEEAYLSCYYKAALRSLIIPDPDMGYFDHIRLSGGKAGSNPSVPGVSRPEGGLAAQVQDACAGLPVMTEHKLIEIEEPCFKDMSPTELKDLCTVLSSLEDYPYVTVVIHCAEEEFPTADYRAPQGTVWKSLEKAGVRIVPFRMQDERRLTAWCGKHFASEGIVPAPGATELMIARVGKSMAALASEMEKLCCYAHSHGSNTVSQEDITAICAVTENSLEFGIASAVRNRDIPALFREYNVLKHRKEEPLNLFFQISSAVTDLWRVKNAAADGLSAEDMMRRFRMKEYPLRLTRQGADRYSPAELDTLMSLCAETDLALKTSVCDGYLLIERLICAVARR